MAEMDMGLSPNNNKKNKKKKKQSLWKSITTGLFPCKGDTAGEICRKVIFLVALATLVAAVVLITAHYMQYVVLDNDAAIDSDGNKKNNQRLCLRSEKSNSDNSRDSKSSRGNNK